MDNGATKSVGCHALFHEAVKCFAEGSNQVREGEGDQTGNGYDIRVSC